MSIQIESNAKIIIVDDNLPANDPIITLIRKHYKDVNLYSEHEEALSVIQNNLTEKLIVVLDYDLGDSHFNGHNMLLEIRKLSFLIPVILFTANIDELKDVPDFINNKTYGLAAKSNSAGVVDLVRKAEVSINTSVQGAVEEYMTKQEQRKLNEPFFITANGKQYSLKQILDEIRMQTEIGKGFEKDMYMLTIDLLLRQKEKLK